MRKYHLFLVSFIALSVAACNNDDYATLLSVDIGAPDHSDPSFYEYFSGVEIIPLEDSILLSNHQYSEPQYLAITEDSYFVLDERTNSVVRFGKDGRFIEETSRRGRGSGEYTLAYAIRAEEASHTLKVLDPRGSVYLYDIAKKGRFISVENMDGVVAVQNFIPAGDKMILFSSSEKNHLRVWDGNSLSNIPYRPEIPLKGQYNAANPIICDNDDYFYYEGYSGSIYSLNPDLQTISLSYAWDFGGHSLDKSKIIDPRYDFLGLLKEDLYNTVFPFTNLQIIGDVIFASVIYHNQEHNLIYDLNTGKYNFFRAFSEGIRFKFHAKYNGDLFLLIEPESICEFINEPILDEHNRVILEEIQRDYTNPIILKYSLRR